ncbi:hypothetical protein MMC26_001501 [Xylographa opegraphella]|nr:hypothetical protein [Xylographa opegraphella]
MASLPRTHQALTMKKIDGKPGAVWYPLQLTTVPTPVPSASQLLIRPTHLSLNHRDLFLRQALYPSPSFTTPLFSDACCVVLSSAHHKSSTEPPRVLLNPAHGWIDSPLGPESPANFAILGGTSTNPLGLAQDFLVVDASETAPCPTHLSGAEAAALPLTGLTGWRALVTKAGIIDSNSDGTYSGKDKHLLVTGIGGGVALTVLLFAVQMGVKVWVTSGDATKISKAKVLGAAGGVSYKEKGWEKELKGMLPKERPYLDAIIDGAGGDIVLKGGRLLKPGGAIVSYGMTLAPSLPYTMQAVLNNVEVRGSTMGSRAEFCAMVAFVAKQKIRPVVSRVLDGGLQNLEGIESLFEDMKAGRQFGKLVIALGGAGKGLEGGESKL